MHSETCEHRVESYPHTELDGTVKTIPYCLRCGFEWTATKEQTS